jgi:hypothetical protein
VLWSYGTRGNDDYFVYHGFALPNNPDEDVVLFEDVQQLLSWALQRLPQLQPLAAAGWDHQQLAAVAGGALAGLFVFLLPLTSDYSQINSTACMSCKRMNEFRC